MHSRAPPEDRTRKTARRPRPTRRARLVTSRSASCGALTVDEGEGAEPPTLKIASTSLNVQAGGSVSLGITATPVDSDDTVSVKIAGVPKYEMITAPTRDTVTSAYKRTVPTPGTSPRAPPRRGRHSAGSC